MLRQLNFRGLLHLPPSLSFAVEHLSTRSTPSNADDEDILLTNRISFPQAHVFLTKQAKRTVIVEISDSDNESCLKNAQEVLSKHGKIAYFSRLATLSNGRRYLVEFTDALSADSLLNLGEDGAIVSRMVKLRHSRSGKAAKTLKDASVFKWKQESLQDFSSKVPQVLKNELNKQSSMEAQIELIKNMLPVSSDEIRCRYLLLSAMNDIFRRNLGTEYMLRPFGSSLSGAGIPGSDMDILIVSSNYMKNTNKALPRLHNLIDRESASRSAIEIESIEILHSAKDIIKTHLQVEDLQLLLEPRVPLLKFYYPLLGLPVDLTVNQLNGFNFLNLINWYVRYDHRVRLMLLLIRKWAESRLLLDRGKTYRGFTPFMLQMLVLVYLARVNVIPQCADIGKTHRDAFDITMSPSSFRVREGVLNTESVSELLLGFFEYYANHGLRGKQLCILYGRIRTRNRPQSKMWIRNPFDHSRNIAEHCNIAHAEEMVSEMKRTVRDLRRLAEKRENKDWGLSCLIFDCTGKLRTT